MRCHHNGRRCEEFGQADDSAIKFPTGQVTMAVLEDARMIVDIFDEEGIDIEKESHNPNDYNSRSYAFSRHPRVCERTDVISRGIAQIEIAVSVNMEATTDVHMKKLEATTLQYNSPRIVLGKDCTLG